MTAQTTDATSTATPRDMANAVRALAMDAVERANSGHPGMPMGMADAATVLFTRFLKFDPKAPKWADRDRFVLSAGHGSMLLYALLHLTGYEDMTLDEVKNFRQLGARTAGHPEYGHASGIETTTGPLGQGIANAVGMALAERLLAARFGGSVVDHYTYVIAGDGCLMEGISQEAISLAGHLKLSKLIVLWDDNGISIDGPVSLSSSEDQRARFEAAGWATDAVDGHDAEAVAAALDRARSSDKPVMIACRTVIGYGAPKKAGTSGVHGAALGAEEIAGTREALAWPHAPFEIPADIRTAWAHAGARGAAEREAWEKRLGALDAEVQADFTRAMAGELPAGWKQALDDYIAGLIASPKTVATRKASEMALEVLVPAIPELIGGSADLTGSNNTRTKGMKPVAPGEFDGRYVFWGIREHGMAAAMNGMALHGGVIPYGGTFLVFTDYCRPAIRLSALMEQRVIYVMTHDSIGLGEDGPTHQPVEHLMSLRMMPNVAVMRPADVVETAECWAAALERTNGPSVLALSRQNLKQLRLEASAENLSAKGAYILREASAAPKAVLLATGSEVEIAVAAAEVLEAKGVPTRVVSMPCWELFAAQPADYQARVLGGDVVRIAIEAGIGFGWERWTGPKGAVIGMTGFGASAPAPELYRHFGITAEAVVDAALARV
ncbi:transketolase [Tistrella mobilis]|uniref:Transketolase n=1 Tax=Tistrella mobilis (strain KA081020-065) TaxID=1110502 RepID=I3TIY7_TISMK|nr:transketolase [Tistrella mobilis]AFK52725.1 transketolase [Tistrella mobilis KA081020-065]